MSTTKVQINQDVVTAQTNIEVSAETSFQSIKFPKKTHSKQWMTAEEFFKIAPKFGRCELVKGEIVSMPPTGGEHGAIAAKILARLLIYVENQDLGEVFAAETGFIIKHATEEQERDTVRGIDVSFVRKERITEVPKKYIPFPPDLAVEVVSPNDSESEIQTKVQEYQHAGVPLIWVVRPEAQTVTVHRLNSKVEVLGTDDMLSGEDVIPDFTCPVADIFA
ncbi:TPA: Uma2 family endonuclease [Candidatus Poribacteria bacterium]|nr:Uma2 family endonuclease [Candidatus Poribacteria bacterium]